MSPIKRKKKSFLVFIAVCAALELTKGQNAVYFVYQVPVICSSNNLPTDAGAECPWHLRHSWFYVFTFIFIVVTSSWGSVSLSGDAVCGRVALFCVLGQLTLSPAVTLKGYSAGVSIIILISFLTGMMLLTAHGEFLLWFKRKKKEIFLDLTKVSISSVKYIGRLPRHETVYIIINYTHLHVISGYYFTDHFLGYYCRSVVSWHFEIGEWHKVSKNHVGVEPLSSFTVQWKKICLDGSLILWIPLWTQSGSLLLLHFLCLYRGQWEQVFTLLFVTITLVFVLCHFLL